MISTRRVLFPLVECNFHTQYEFDRHEWDNNTHEFDFMCDACDFNTNQLKINVRLPKNSGFGFD
jgi:hypothetical protein